MNNQICIRLLSLLRSIGQQQKGSDIDGDVIDDILTNFEHII